MKKFGQFVNESNVSPDFVFRTEVTDVSEHFLFEKLSVENNWTKEQYNDFECNPDRAYVYWILQPDVRTDRVKSMDLLVKRVVSTVEWYIVEDNEEYIELDTNSPDFKDWQIISSVDFQNDGGVCPTSVELDFRNKKITVE